MHGVRSYCLYIGMNVHCNKINWELCMHIALQQAAWTILDA